VPFRGALFKFGVPAIHGNGSVSLVSYVVDVL
jgi:hypothetical protein